MYYHLSRARQGRRIRDVVLVRLEQIAPFPHDLVGKVRAVAYASVCSAAAADTARDICACYRACAMAGSPPLYLGHTSAFMPCSALAGTHSNPCTHCLGGWQLQVVSNVTG